MGTILFWTLVPCTRSYGVSQWGWFFPSSTQKKRWFITSPLLWNVPSPRDNHRPSFRTTVWKELKPCEKTRRGYRTDYWRQWNSIISQREREITLLDSTPSIQCEICRMLECDSLHKHKSWWLSTQSNENMRKADRKLLKYGSLLVGGPYSQQAHEVEGKSSWKERGLRSQHQFCYLHGPQEPSHTNP